MSHMNHNLITSVWYLILTWH